METEKAKDSVSTKSDTIESLPEPAIHREEKTTLMLHISLAQRILLLLGCCGLGLVIGFIGQSFTSQSVWYLAVPICIAVAWFFVADPNDCTACVTQLSREHAPPR